jgi:hypothetical protein
MMKQNQLHGNTNKIGPEYEYLVQVINLLNRQVRRMNPHVYCLHIYYIQ